MKKDFAEPHSFSEISKKKTYFHCIEILSLIILRSVQESCLAFMSIWRIHKACNHVYDENCINSKRILRRLYSFARFLWGLLGFCLITLSPIRRGYSSIKIIILLKVNCISETIVLSSHRRVLARIIKMGEQIKFLRKTLALWSFNSSPSLWIKASNFFPKQTPSGTILRLPILVVKP